MDKKFLAKFAFKNLYLHKLRSLLTLSGIIIGMSAILFLVSFGFGLEALVTREVTGGDAFKLIDVGTGNSQVVKLNAQSVNGPGGLSSVTNVKKVYVTINAGGKVKNGTGSMDVAFYGTQQEYIKLSGTRIKWGTTFSQTSGSREIVANTAFLKFLGTDSPQKYLGQDVSIDIIIPKELTDGVPEKKVADQTFKIVGIIQDSASPGVYADYSFLETAGAEVFSQAKVELTTTDSDKVLSSRKQIENMGFKTQYVGDTVSQIEQIFGIFKVILGSFGLIALIVAALGMFNTLTISLLERIKEIALMKILGMRKRDIRGVFLFEAVIMGTFGGIVGILIGVILSNIANSILNFFAQRSGGDMVNVFSYPVWFVVGMFVFSFLIGLITGIYPAYRATRVNALDVLRYE